MDLSALQEGIGSCTVFGQAPVISVGKIVVVFATTTSLFKEVRARFTTRRMEYGTCGVQPQKALEAIADGAH